MTEKQLSHLHTQLVDLQDRLRDDARHRADALPETVLATGDDSHAPTHVADQDVEGLDAEIEAARVQGSISEQIHEALQRISDGTYGVCQSCGIRIKYERLKAVPYTPYCVRCEEQFEQSQGR